jgi:hypothetical protein
MKNWTGALAATLTLAFFWTPAAATAEVGGDPCVADGTEAGATMIGLDNQPSEPFMQPNVPPEGTWIVTGWRVQVGAGIGPIAQQLVISHQRGEETDQKMAESALETLVPGTNEFATRLPASEYDHVGLSGPAGALICHHPMNVAGRVANPFALGEERHFEILVNVGVPVVVNLERDIDGDGYGDQTQDECPWLAAAHENCAGIDLTVVPTVTKRAIRLEIRTGSPTNTSVTGTIGWRRAGAPGRVVVGLDREVPEVPFEGTASVRLPLPKSVKQHLAKLPRSQWVRARITFLADNEKTAPVREVLLLKLPGRSRG